MNIDILRYFLFGIAGDLDPHKTIVLLMSAVGTPEYKLVQCLDNLIKAHIWYTYLLCSTENFIERFKECPYNNENTMLSFDVASFFTNIETIELVIE